MRQPRTINSGAEIVLFHPKHLEVADIREHEYNGIFALDDISERLEMLAKNSSAMTMICDGRVITCAGFVQLWPGVIEVWQIPSKWVNTKPLMFSKILKGYVESIAKTFQCHRIQTSCPDDPLHDRWMGWLGFEHEGTLRQYSHNKINYKLWARIFQWE